MLFKRAKTRRLFFAKEKTNKQNKTKGKQKRKQKQKQNKTKQNKQTKKPDRLK